MLGRLASSVFLLLFCCVVHAAVSLQDRLGSFQTLSANFIQTTESGSSADQMKGSVKIKRPNRFYWKINSPDEQSIISNGQKIWQYEPELDQVIVRKVDQSLQGVPLMLLSGKTTDIEHIFKIEAQSDILFVLTPRSEDQMVKKVEVSFTQDRLAGLQIENTLGQVISIVFSQVEQNQPIDDSFFEFQVPSKVEVVEQ